MSEIELKPCPLCARENCDDPATTVYGSLIWHHMDASRKGDEALRRRIFDALNTLAEVYPRETAIWEDRYRDASPSTQGGE